MGIKIAMNIKIIVATHKKYEMPSDPMYVPLFVGKEGKTDIGIAGDDTGENISRLNPRFCELTGIYWAWKNLHADYIGLAHYRRHFTKQPFFRRTGKNNFNAVITQEELLPLLRERNLIFPKQREYAIESLYSHYSHLPYAHERDLLLLRDVIKVLQLEYEDVFDKVMARTHAHMFNMFIMKWELFDRYCQWLFPILFEVDRRIDLSMYSPMEARAVSYLGEFMLDIWNEKQKIPYFELPVMFMEKQNWLVKGGKFLVRKAFPHK